MTIAQLIYRALTDPNTHQALESGAFTPDGAPLLPAQLAAVGAVLRLPQQTEGGRLIQVFVEKSGWESRPAGFSIA